jgi:hypothetical protein
MKLFESESGTLLNFNHVVNFFIEDEIIYCKDVNDERHLVYDLDVSQYSDGKGNEFEMTGDDRNDLLKILVTVIIALHFDKTVSNVIEYDKINSETWDIFLVKKAVENEAKQKRESKNEENLNERVGSISNPHKF